MVYCYEQLGEFNGLICVCGFMQDDVYIFCCLDQFKCEFLDVFDLMVLVFKIFGMIDVCFCVGVCDFEFDKYVGDEQNWVLVECQIIEVVEEVGLFYIIEFGDVVFYGFKFDFVVKDVLGCEWQFGIIQVDYNLFECFDIFYIGEDGQEYCLIMIYCVFFGFIECFIGILIEYYVGDFLLWLVFWQVMIIFIVDCYNVYVEELCEELYCVGLCVEVDDFFNCMQVKVCDVELYKILVMLIVGDKEQEVCEVSVCECIGEGIKECKGVKFDELKVELLEWWKNWF